MSTADFYSRHSVLLTLELLCAWLGLALLITGIGYLVRRTLLRSASALDRAPAMTDVWIGLVALIAYLQTWNLFLAISWMSWLAPLLFGCLGLVACFRHIKAVDIAREHLSFPVIIFIVLAVVWMSNLAVGADASYDDGLYHLGIVHYGMNFATIPGLANLHERFGAADPTLLFVSFLGRAFTLSGGIHLANGLLATLLCLDIGCRFIARKEEQVVSSFTQRLALFLGVATVLVIANGPTERISSADLDFVTYVLTAAGVLYLAEAVESIPAPVAAPLAAVALLTVAAVTRPLFWGFVVAALAAIGLAHRHRYGADPVMRPVVIVIPTVLALTWAARQAWLTGYPFFPLTVGGLPVDWKVPAAVITTANRWIFSWARQPGLPPDQVLKSWHWFMAWWVPHRMQNADLAAPLALLIVALRPRAFMRDLRHPTRKREVAAFTAVLVPSALLVVAWFFIAPDPRFALAPIWLCPVAIAAWPRDQTYAIYRGSWPIALAGLVIAGLLFGALVHRIVGSSAHRAIVLVPFALLFVPFILVRNRHAANRFANALARASVPAVLAVSVGVVASRGPFTTGQFGPRGVFGTAPPTPSLVDFTTVSGLKLVHPATGDQCWAVLFCATGPTPDLALRKKTFAAGFRLTH